MKYYHYLSLSKIDMLFAQVPRNLREKVSAEFGFNVGVVSGSVKAEANRFDEPVARLKAVERYLIAHNEIGTIEEPREWFAGEMMARTLGFQFSGGAVFFVGRGSYGTIITLGGSQSNLLGAKLDPTPHPPYSDFTPMLHALEAILLNDTNSGVSNTRRLEYDDGRNQAWTWDRVVEYLVQAMASTDAPLQQVHFLARPLATTDGPMERIIIGTPLYVAGGSANSV